MRTPLFALSALLASALGVAQAMAPATTVTTSAASAAKP
jgi:hypothetical protein